MKRLHIFYSGYVQGVGFRYTAEEAARQCGLTGWVRNRRDGSVEVLAEGEEKALLNFLSAMKSGPLGANIHKADATWQEATGEFQLFTIRSTE
jgi:acylphosphatase